MRAIAFVLGTGILALPHDAAAQSVAFAPTSTRMVLIGPENVESAFHLNQPAHLGSAAQDRALMAECGRARDTRMSNRSLVIPAMMAISRKGVRLVLDRIERRLQAQLEKYSAVYRAETEGLFYRYANANGQPLLRYNCLRIVRLPTGTDDGEAELDLLLQLRLTPQGDGMELVPLRLYLGSAAAHTDDGRVNISVSLAAEAVWRDSTTGRVAEVFEEIIFDASASADNGAGGAIYFPADEMKPVLVPIVPISTGVDTDMPYGFARLTAIVAETAVPPASLQATADLLARRADGISVVLLRASETRLSGLTRR